MRLTAGLRPFRDSSSVNAGLWWVAALIYATGIFLLSSQSTLPGGEWLPEYGDKVIHAVVFGGLSIVVANVLRRSQLTMTTLQCALWAIALTAVYALSDEIHQSFVPGRSSDGWDFAADVTGACLAQVWTFRHRWQGRDPNADRRV